MSLWNKLFGKKYGPAAPSQPSPDSHVRAAHLSPTVKNFIATNPTSQADDPRAAALLAQATELNITGDYDGARVVLYEALAICRANSDLVGLGNALRAIGFLDSIAGDYENARVYEKEALALFRRGNHKTQEAYALMGLGNTEKALGRNDAAMQCFSMAADIYRDLGMLTNMEMAVANVGWLTPEKTEVYPITPSQPPAKDAPLTPKNLSYRKKNNSTRQAPFGHQSDSDSPTAGVSKSAAIPNSHSTPLAASSVGATNLPPAPNKEATPTSLPFVPPAVDLSNPLSRRIRVFISSTFRDMMEERDEMMAHTWPQLRRLCQDRQVEFVEVDLRWGVTEAQSTRKETLKLCLDEIRACRPYFIGILGERYGWTPPDDVFTSDLQEEQPWVEKLKGRSVTEMEILHGVLNNPEMAGQAFFYFRDPAYSQSRGADYLSETPADAQKQTDLKEVIRTACAARNIPLMESYATPKELASHVLTHLSAAIDARFPADQLPDPLTREANSHEVYAQSRCRTYIGRSEYYERLDRQAAGDGGPLFLLGESGGGKSALLANWLKHWRDAHKNDFIFQHYIGSTSDSADHVSIVRRLMQEIKRWTGDPDEIPAKPEELLRDFPLWLAKAKAKAHKDGVRCILVLDALNQLLNKDQAHSLHWLPEHSFNGPLRLFTSTLSGPAQNAVEARGWEKLTVQPLNPSERDGMISHYLARFGKKLDDRHRENLIAAPQTANPLYLKILLDELRITGTFEGLEARIREYLAAADIPALLGKVLARWQRDYNRDCPNLVGQTLGLIFAARRGLAESELLELLRPAGQPQIPQALWSPFRSAVDEFLISRDEVFTFAHDYLRLAVENAFATGQDTLDDLRLRLADHFEPLPPTRRTCDELPWLLDQTESFARLRACLLNIDRFLLIRQREGQEGTELSGYWVRRLKAQETMGQPYLQSFDAWVAGKGEGFEASYAANQVGAFLDRAAFHQEAESLYRRALKINEHCYGANHPGVAILLNNLALLLKATNRLEDAEPLYRRALKIDEQSYGANHPSVARDLNNLAQLLKATNRLAEAEPLMVRALNIHEKNCGANHPDVASDLNNLAWLLKTTNRLTEAEPLMVRALQIDEQSYGASHPSVAIRLNSLAQLLQATNRLVEAEPLMRRALQIDEQSCGANHPSVATCLNNLAQLLQATNRLAEAEPLMRRALKIHEHSYGENHSDVAIDLNNLAQLLKGTNRLAEAEPLLRRALKIDEHCYGANHPDVAIDLNNLAGLLQATNRLGEAEQLYCRALQINEQSYGENHPSVAICLNNLAGLLEATNSLAEAEPLYRRALKINEQSYGAHHPDVASCLNNLAGLLKTTNRHTEAELLYRRALEINEQSYGESHPSVAMCLNNLSGLLQATNRLADAEPLCRRALKINEQSYGENHPDVARSYNNLARLLETANRLAEAEPLYRRALKIIEQSYGENHPDTAMCLNNLARLLKTSNRLAEAEPLYRRALKISEQSYGDNHPYVAICLNNLAQLLKDLSRLVDAERLMRRAMTIFAGSLGGSHPNTQTAAINYVSLLQAMGKPENEIRAILADLARRYGIDIGAAGGQAGNEPSLKLRVVLEDILRDQSKINEIAARLQREDPALFQELVQFIQGQQRN